MVVTRLLAPRILWCSCDRTGSRGTTDRAGNRISIYVRPSVSDGIARSIRCHFHDNVSADNIEPRFRCSAIARLRPVRFYVVCVQALQAGVGRGPIAMTVARRKYPNPRLRTPPLAFVASFAPPL